MPNQEIVLRKFGKETVELLLQDYHAFAFCLHTDDESGAEGQANMLMYDISLNLANEFLELNWGNWVLIDAATAREIGFISSDDNSYYLMGFLVNSYDTTQAKRIDEFLRLFIPNDFINVGKKPATGGSFGEY